MKRRALYPGTFDPITNGHLDLIDRGAALFDELLVAVAVATPKQTAFTAEERVEMIRGLVRDRKHVAVETFDGLVVEFARARGIRTILRGLRTVSDFEYEFQMALTNRALAPEVDTVFVMPNEKFSYLSSTLIKDAVRLGGDVSRFVPPEVEKALRARLGGKRV